MAKESAGRVAIFDPGGFAEPSWVSLFLGLGLQPEAYDPFIDHIDPQALLQHFVRLRRAIAETAAGMPEHADYIRRHRGNKILQKGDESLVKWYMPYNR